MELGVGFKSCDDLCLTHEKLFLSIRLGILREKSIFSSFDYCLLLKHYINCFNFKGSPIKNAMQRLIKAVT